MTDCCTACGCPIDCPEGRIEAVRQRGLALGALFGVLCSAAGVFVIGLIACLA